MRKSEALTDLPQIITVSDDKNTDLIVGLIDDNRLYISIEECADDDCNGDMCCIYLSPTTTVELIKWLTERVLGRGSQATSDE